MVQHSKLYQHLADIDPNVLEVLRSHLFAEQVLNERICIHLEISEEALDGKELMFHKKLKLAEAAGLLPESLLDSFGKLNALRNRCAHRFQYSPQRAEVLALFDRMPEEMVYESSTIDLYSVFKRFAGAICNQLSVAGISTAVCTHK